MRNKKAKMAIRCFNFWFLILFSHSLALDESFKNNIKEIRANVLKKAEADSSLFHPDDVKYLKDNDWPILRFLIDTKNDKDKAQERVIKTFTWRNKELPKLDQLPAEVHRQKMILQCGQSIAGRPLFQIKANRVTFVDKLIPLVVKHFANVIDKVEHENSGEKGFDVVIDFEGYSPALFEPKFVTKVMELAEHFPVEPRNVYLYRFPWVYETLWGLIKPLLLKHIADLMIFVEDGKQLEKYVKLDQVDKNFGGTNECKTSIPDGVESGICQSKFNIKEEDWKKFYKERKENFKAEANKNGYKSVAEMFECKNGNSAANEIIKKVADN